MLDSTPEVPSPCDQGGLAAHFARGELGGVELSRFQRHLEHCPACRARVSEVSQLVSFLRQGAATASPCDLEAIQGRVREGLTSLRLARIRAVISAGAALLLLAASVVWLKVGPSFHMEPGPDLALDRAARWLRSSQEPWGGWDPARWGGLPEHRIGVSALAVVALARAEPGASRAEVLAGARYIASEQRPSGFIGEERDGALYCHALGTLALLEANELGPDAPLRSSIQNALDRLLAGLRERGLDQPWIGRARAESLAGELVWPVEVLSRARELGWPALDEALVRGAELLARGSAPGGEGGRGRLHGGARPGSQSGELFRTVGALLAAGPGGTSPSARRAVEGMALELASRQAPVEAFEAYFMARALSATPSSPLRQRLWAGRAGLSRRQIPRGPLAGSWEPGSQLDAAGGRLATTALLALALDASRREP